MFALLVFAVYFGISIIGAVLSGGSGEMGGFTMVMLGIFALAIIVPSIAVQVRRFHDQDKSGWLVLLGFIPFVGGFIVLYFMVMEGTRGPNQYGPDPKA